VVAAAKFGARDFEHEILALAFLLHAVDPHVVVEESDQLGRVLLVELVSDAETS
jgi:hypothetical protein